MCAHYLLTTAYYRYYHLLPLLTTAYYRYNHLLPLLTTAYYCYYRLLLATQCTSSRTCAASSSCDSSVTRAWP